MKKNKEQLLQYILIFNKIGINISQSIIIDKSITVSKTKKIVKNSDIIFLLGGSPELQMKFILEYNLVEEIKSSKFVIGVSAESMNQSKKVI